MGINKDQLLNYVIIPTLQLLNLDSEAARNLLLGTCAQESQMGTFLHQINGPALGIYQMEPNTHNDIWNNYLHNNYALISQIKTIAPSRDASALVYNLAYATAMTRIHYLRVDEPLPDANDIAALGGYYKYYYNSPQGAATIDQFVENYKRYVL